MSRFHLSLLAKQDLEEIADYLGDRNPPAALKVVETLVHRIAALVRQPLLGELREDVPGHPRCLGSGNYLIVYQPADDGVDIVRVVHAARDIESLLASRPGPTGQAPG